MYDLEPCNFVSPAIAMVTHLNLGMETLELELLSEWYVRFWVAAFAGPGVMLETIGNVAAYPAKQMSIPHLCDSNPKP